MRGESRFNSDITNATDLSTQISRPPTTDQILKFYEQLPTIYAANDRWLTLSHRWISDFVSSEFKNSQGHLPLSCLNLGSGGLAYGIPEEEMIHVDIHSDRFAQNQRVVVADIQRLPPFARLFDKCLCVGSVLNHCDAVAVIASISQNIRQGGHLIIEFETTKSFELLPSPHFGRSAAVIDTFYQDRTIRLWAYHERYVRGLLEASGFIITRRSSRHHLSPLVYLLSHNSNFAARFAFLDTVARHLPFFRTCASHVIFSCQKLE